MKPNRLAVLLALFAASGLAAAQHLYRWTDADGKVHVTDSPPPANARDVQKMEGAPAPAAADADSSGLAAAMKQAPVVLYTSPNCEEPCKLARDALNKRGVPFKEVQVWSDETAAELKKVSGSNEVPVLVVGQRLQKGFQQSLYDSLLDSANYPKAGVLPPLSQGAPKPPEGYSPPADVGAASAPQEEAVGSGPYSPKPPAKPQPEPARRYAPIPGNDQPATGPYGTPQPESAQPK